MPGVRPPAPDQTGILIAGSSNNTIGGITSAAGNVISGNSVDGIEISGTGTTGNIVAGNLIGTDLTGTQAVANSVGVKIDSGASANTIGGTSDGEGNLISGNQGDGVQLNGTSTADNLVAGNQIGTDTTGELPLSNGGAGST